jgi:hypothetical protein
MANPEEDLDAYLDNVLDEFQEPEKEKSEEEFMALLQENMNKLLTGELDQNAILDTLKNSAKVKD